MNIRSSFACLLCCLPFIPASAEESGQSSHVTLTASLAWQYDSNINIAELDNVSQQSDSAAVGNIGLQWQWRPAALSLKAGANYLAKRYRQLDDYDMDIASGYAGIAYDVGWFTLGADYAQANADVAADPFLTYRQSLLSISRLFDDRIYLRLARMHKDKDFDQDVLRNAQGDGYEGDLFWFGDAGKTFVNFGGSTEQEEADDRQYSNQSWNAKLRYSHKFDLAGHGVQFQTGWHRSERDYDDIGLLTEARKDRRDAYDLEWEIEWTSPLSLDLRVEYARNRSTLEPLTYNETLASISLKAKF